MKKRITTILFSVTFLGIFFYFYKKSGKFRKSICAALVAAFVLTSGPLESEAKGVDAFSTKPPQHRSSSGDLSGSRANNPGKPNNGGSGGDDRGDDDKGMPQCPKVESVEETENQLENIDGYIRQLEESSDSESEEEQCPIPEQKNKTQENDSSISEEEEENIKQPVKLEVDFPYEYDSNGDPTLLVPNPAKARTKREYNRVEFDQTASHMHHAADFNISLPSDFDMAHYMSLNRADRIDYAKQKLSRETIIHYQNEIGKSMSPRFGPKKTFAVPGFAGKFKQNTELTIQQTNTPNKTIFSIIREDGLHISSYSVDDRALQRLTKDNFWVLKNRNL